MAIPPSSSRVDTQQPEQVDLARVARRRDHLDLHALQMPSRQLPLELRKHIAPRRCVQHRLLCAVDDGPQGQALILRERCPQAQPVRRGHIQVERTCNTGYAVTRRRRVPRQGNGLPLIDHLSRHARRRLVCPDIPSRLHLVKRLDQPFCFIQPNGILHVRPPSCCLL